MSLEQPSWSHDHELDGGDRGCGDLLLDLRLFFQGLAPGSRVRVTARDPGAPIELPAWCRLTGHRLLDQAHPWYLIERR